MHLRLVLFACILALPALAAPHPTVEATERACYEGDRAACERAAKIYDEGKEVPRDPARAATLRVKLSSRPTPCAECEPACGSSGSDSKCLDLCDRGIDEACSAAAHRLIRSDDTSKLFAVLERQCGNKVASACGVIGGMTLGGLVGRKKDPTRAVAWLTTGCEGHDKASCGTLGLLTISGQVVKKDEARGAAMLGESCARGYWPACDTLGHAYENGAGVPSNENLAASAYAVACMPPDGGPSVTRACLTVADLYEQGTYLRKDTARALTFYRKACAAGDAAGCEGTKRIQAVNPTDTPSALDHDQSAKFQAAIQPYVAQARRTYPDAKKRYLAGLPPQHKFFVTAQLHDPDGKWEQVFLGVQRIEDGKIHGRIANQLDTVKTFHRGQEVEIPENELLDWMIERPDGTEEGNVVGKFLDTYQP